jgi:hypothetical protein
MGQIAVRHPGTTVAIVAVLIAAAVWLILRG